MKRWITFLMLICLGSAWGAEQTFDEARSIAIQAGGRKKPLDTFAMESLQAISGQRFFRDPQTGQTRDAIDVLCSIWFKERDWADIPIILISEAALRKELGLSSTDRLFSLNTLLNQPALTTLYHTTERKRVAREELTPLEKQAEILFDRMEILRGLISNELLTIVPNTKVSRGNWWPPSLALETLDEDTGKNLALILKGISDAYLSRNSGLFRTGFHQLHTLLAQLAPADYPSPSLISMEIHYNHLHAFRWAWILYLISFFILIPKKAFRLGTAFFAAGLAMHIDGLILRCLIAGRPPVTNMYESVIWVSLGIAAFALIFRLIHHTRIYILASAPLAVLGLILADMLPAVLNPNIGPLPPVLRDNFWLTIHVLTITLGYAAFAVATGFGHIILGAYLFKPGSIDKNSPLHELLYHVLRLGVLLLAAGTILGGVWANYSWGRFWGWDPKETWALIALLLYIFAIHGRMVGWWGQFGLSVAAALCFNGVLMAWYGVNFVLGKGLHSYGFSAGGVPWVASIVALDLVFVTLSIMARRRRPTFS